MSAPMKRVADKVYELLIREDFQSNTFAYFLTSYGTRIQVKLYDLIVSIIELWVIDYDSGNDKGDPDYLRVTIQARQLLDVIEGQKRLKRKRR